MAEETNLDQGLPLGCCSDEMLVAMAIRKCPGQKRLEKALAVTELFPKGSSFSDLVPKA